MCVITNIACDGRDDLITTLRGRHIHPFGPRMLFKNLSWTLNSLDTSLRPHMLLPTDVTLNNSSLAPVRRIDEYIWQILIEFLDFFVTSLPKCPESPTNVLCKLLSGKQVDSRKPRSILRSRMNNFKTIDFIHIFGRFSSARSLLKRVEHFRC